MKISILLAVSSGSTAFSLRGRDQFDPQSYSKDNIITKDVAVIGGGGSGIYAAANLYKLGKSVVVVEKESITGGHTNTYVDQATGVSINYGVQAYWNSSVTRDYFDLLGLTYGAGQFSPSTPFYANFKTGVQIPGALNTRNFTAWQAELNKYPYIEYTWDLPKPIPSDLLLPFRDYIKKYSLDSSVFTIFGSAGGVGNFFNELTVNILKYVDPSFLESISGHSVVPSPNNAEIYKKATALLGNTNVLVSSTVVATRRSNGKAGGISLVLQTPTGKKLVQASKLLISIPPLLDTMRPFDLDSNESALFAKWSYSDYYTILVNNTGLPAGYTFTNANESTSTWHVPQLPAPYGINPTRVPGLFYVWYGSPTRVTETQVKAEITAAIKRLRPTVNSTATTEPQFLGFNSHSPFKLVVGANDIESGFYEKLEGLQGKRNTYYTGAAFISHGAAVLWNYTLPIVHEIAGL